MSNHDNSLLHNLNTYTKSDAYPFHMPGHKRQAILAVSPESIDITEISGFDDLHHAEGILKEAQERMAEVFGAHKSFFLVNGSTAGILAAICACTKKGGRILMARNCHKSVYHAALLQDLSVDYINPAVSEHGITGSISPDDIFNMLNLQKGPLKSVDSIGSISNSQLQTAYQAVVITSPTYDGIVSDIAAIAEIAHAHGIPLIVDEAHGAHFGFSDGFPKKALSYGADIVIESIHKTLPAFTQSAALHLADSPYVNEAKVKQYLSIFQTSSPSYILMAGMDRCTQLIKEKGPDLFFAYKKKLTAFYEKASGLKNISVLYADEHLINLKDTIQGTNTPVMKDPSKILISADAIGLTGSELFAILRDRYHLELEMASLHYVTALTTFMDTQEGFDRLIGALEELDQADKKPVTKKDTNPVIAEPAKATADVCINVIQGQETPLHLYEATNLPSETVRLVSATGKICADFIIPYPPGIPLLVPGEMIKEEHILEISQYLNDDITVYGIQKEPL